MRRSNRRLAVPVLTLPALAVLSMACGPGVPLRQGLPTTTTNPTAPTTTQETVPPKTTTTTAPTFTPTGALLSLGDSGPQVLAVQQRLTDLGYWLGTPDGSFGQLTEQAVMALQKAAGLKPDGVLGPLTDTWLTGGIRPSPRSDSGHVVEIDLEHQLLLLVTAGHVDTVLNTSTGTGMAYSSQGRTEVATTPKGTFSVFRQVDGTDVSPLGVLWRPKYFVGGVAVHGYSDVPPYPASHGCVRVSTAAMDWIWSAGLMPIGTAVWVY